MSVCDDNFELYCTYVVTICIKLKVWLFNNHKISLSICKLLIVVYNIQVICSHEKLSNLCMYMAMYVYVCI